jgi:hypothetical protein
MTYTEDVQKQFNTVFLRVVVVLDGSNIMTEKAKGLKGSWKKK